MYGIRWLVTREKCTSADIIISSPRLSRVRNLTDLIKNAGVPLESDQVAAEPRSFLLPGLKNFFHVKKLEKSTKRK